MFSVDLFNGGENIPAVDTLLMLHPERQSHFVSPAAWAADFAVVGGRQSVPCSTLLVTIVKSFGLTDGFRRSWAVPARNSPRRIEARFSEFYPLRSHMELDRVAADIVLEGARGAVPYRWTDRVAALKELTTGGATSSPLARYLEETGLDLDDVSVAIDLVRPPK